MKKFFSALLSVAMVSSAFVSMASAAGYDVIELKVGDTVIAENTNIDVDINSSIDFVMNTKDVNGSGLNIGLVYDDSKTAAFADAFEFTSVTNGSGKASYKIYNDVEEDDVGSTVKPTVASGNKNGLVTWGFMYAQNANWSAVENFAKFSMTAKKAGTYKFYARNTLTVGTSDVVNNVPFTITVKDAGPADVKVTGITATPAELKALTVGDKGKIDVAVAPADATEKGVTFASDAEDVISVDADGNYEAKSAGTAKITITAKDGSGVTATVEVSVSAPVIPEPEKVQFVKAVKSDKAATGYWVFKVNKGITETLKVTYANADEKLELDAPAAIGGESDVTFALYLTVTGDRIGKAYTAAVAHGADSATGDAIVLD